ncbi:MAG: nucleotidyltransferase [Actinomycetota bacterium]|nr:nucleotidyltransferase [Actinomycetota bacterium]
MSASSKKVASVSSSNCPDTSGAYGAEIGHREMGDNVAVGEDPQPQQVADLYSEVWEGQGDVDDDVFLRVLGEAAEAIESLGIPYVLMGGMVSRTAGRPRDTHDIDFLVRPDEAGVALEALRSAGFDTRQSEPQWLYKAVKEGVLVDILFRATGDVLLDDEMVDRAKRRDFGGHQMPAMSVEDLIIIKALSHQEHTARHWFDALALLSNQEVDWDYLVRRARRRGARRVLSLLLYGQSVDVLVPDKAVHDLYDVIYQADKD